MYLVLTYLRLWVSDEVRLIELDIIQCHPFTFSLDLVSYCLLDIMRLEEAD